MRAKLFLTLLMVGILANGFATGRTVHSYNGSPKEVRIVPGTPTAAELQNHRAHLSRGQRAATCASGILDYNAYNEVIAAQEGNTYHGSWYATPVSPLAQEITSSAWIDAAHSGDYYYAGVFWDSLVTEDLNATTVTGIPKSNATVSMDSLGMFIGVFGDTTHGASTKMAHDSIIFSVYSITGGTNVALVKTIVYTGFSGNNSLSRFFVGRNYIKYVQIPVNYQFAQGQGFSVLMSYHVKDTSSHMLLSYTYADSCGSVLYNGVSYASPAKFSPIVGSSYFGSIEQTGASTYGAFDEDNTYIYGLPGIPDNCDYLYTQNWEMLPIITICESTDVAATVTTNAATSIGQTTATLNGVVNNASGLTSTTNSFDWGLTTSYGNSATATASTTAAGATGNITASLTGLTANTTYHFRAKATNGAGPATGIDRTFTTLSGGSVCTPDAGVTSGFGPDASTVPCVIKNQSFSQTYTFVVPATVTVPGFGTVPITSVKIDSVVNLPTGLTWQANANPATYAGGTSGCILVTGTTNAPCGQYKLLVYVTITAGISQSGELFALAQQFGLTGFTPEYLRVIVQGDVCPSVNDNGVNYTAYAACGGAPLSVTISKTDVSCFGNHSGTATATAAGGAGGYTYLWSNGSTTSAISGLTAGSYSVTVTSNGATASASASITQPASAVSVSTSSTQTACGSNTGTATATATGGTPGYTYLWNNNGTLSTISNLGAGVFNVTVTDNKGCTATGSATVSSPAAFNISLTSTAVNCYGQNTGTATVTPSGTTGNVTYLWNNGGTTATISGIAAGTYVVTVTDGSGCSKSGSTTVTQPASAVAVSVSSTQTGCGTSTGTATATGSGGTPGYTYIWSNSSTSTTISGLAANTYNVTVSDSKSCTATGSAVVSAPASFNVSVTTTGANCYNQASGSANVTVTGASGNLTYLWTNGGTSASISNVIGGNYSVTVTDGNGCSKIGSGTVNQPASAVSVSTSNTQATCGNSNGTATVTASGGTPGFTYAWNTGSTSSTITGLGGGSYTVTATDTKGCSASALVSIISQGTFTVSVTTTGVSCYGESTGSAQATVTGATGNVSYVWSQGAGSSSSISNKPAGTYYVTVTDGSGCSNTAQGTISQPAGPLSVSVSTTNSSCGNSTGSATATVSGNTGNPSYLWSYQNQTNSSISSLSSGAYTVTVTAGGCTATGTGVVVNSNGPTITTQKTDPTCFGSLNGTATAVVSGGTQPYGTITWSTGATGATLTGVGAGTYTVIVVDNTGCQGVGSVTLVQPNAITLNPTTNNVSCHGAQNGNISLSVAGGSGPYSYSWSISGTNNQQSDLSGGPYTVTVTDARNCTVTSTFVITEPAALAVNVTTTPASGNNGTATAAATGGTSPYSYFWSTSQSGSLVTGLSSGVIDVTVTDSHGCSVTGAGDVATGINEVSNEFANVSVYPNPANETLYVTVDVATAHNVWFNITDVTGKVVANLKENANSGKLTQQISLKEFTSGVYILEVGAEQQTVRKKFIVAK